MPLNHAACETQSPTGCHFQEQVGWGTRLVKPLPPNISFLNQTFLLFPAKHFVCIISNHILRNVKRLKDHGHGHLCVCVYRAYKMMATYGDPMSMAAMGHARYHQRSCLGDLLGDGTLYFFQNEIDVFGIGQFAGGEKCRAK